MASLLCFLLICLLLAAFWRFFLGLLILAACVIVPLIAGIWAYAQTASTMGALLAAGVAAFVAVTLAGDAADKLNG